MKIIVTGGASGLGEALVRRLSDHDVWILDINKPDQLAERHHYIAADLSDSAVIDRAVDLLPESIDGLANVAGIAAAVDPATVVAVNFLAVRHLTSALAPRLVEGGSIVNVSSIAGRDWQRRYDRVLPLLETPTFADGLAWCQANQDSLARDPYTFSKRAVTAFSHRAAQDALAGQYRVNCISPGPIETPLYPQFESLMGKPQSDWTARQTGRMATANDISEVIDLLLTGDCGWLNGVDIPVDGGYSAGLAAGWIDFSTSPAMLARKER